MAAGAEKAKPATTGEIETQTVLQHLGDVVLKRGLGTTTTLMGTDGLIHMLITPEHPLPTLEIPNPVVHIAVEPNISGNTMIFIREIEKVDASVIYEQQLQGFPPVKKEHKEKREAIGNGTMQTGTLTENILGYLDPMYNISKAA